VKGRRALLLAAAAVLVVGAVAFANSGRIAAQLVEWGVLPADHEWQPGEP
jgi:hypothetical protein